MRAAVVEALGSGPVLRDRAVPSVPPGSSLVRIAAACLAHVDRSVASGTFRASPPVPYVPATDASGWVEQSGSLPAGTFVWLRGGGLGVERDGVCAEYAVVPDVTLHPAAEGTDPVIAACFFSPSTSAHTAVTVLGRVAAGERVLVTGAAGAVGSLAVQLALREGARVVGSVRSAARARDVPAGAQVVDDVPDSSVDLLIDTVGGARLPDRLRAVRPGGRAVLIGYTAGTRVTFELPDLMFHDVQLLPLNMIRRAPEAFAVADDLLRDLSVGTLRLATTVRDLTELDSAWADLGAGRVRGRLVLRMDGQSRP